MEKELHCDCCGKPVKDGEGKESSENLDTLIEDKIKELSEMTDERFKRIVDDALVREREKDPSDVVDIHGHITLAATILASESRRMEKYPIAKTRLSEEEQVLLGRWLVKLYKQLAEKTGNEWYLRKAQELEDSI